MADPYWQPNITQPNGLVNMDLQLLGFSNHELHQFHKHKPTWTNLRFSMVIYPPKMGGLLTAGSFISQPGPSSPYAAQLRSPTAYHRSSQPARRTRAFAGRRAGTWWRMLNPPPQNRCKKFMNGWFMVVQWLVISWLMVDWWKWFMIVDIWWIHGSKWLVMCDIASTYCGQR